MEIVNRVANSKLVTFNLEDYYIEGERVILDIKSWLFEETILREKDFRLHLKDHDWSIYQDKNVAIHCSVEAIIPVWAYMLIASYLQPVANRVVLGNLQQLENTLFQEALSKINLDDFKDAKVVIKGCGHLPIPNFAYIEIIQKLRPIASSIMYGEPCSTVPVFKRTLQK